MMKLELQKFGGRGASSGASTINGRPVVKSTSGYNYWNIGKNAPKGYIGLIRGTGNNAETVYFKTQYADEIANFSYAGNNAMNYTNLSTLDRLITKKENAINSGREASGKEARIKRELEEMKRARTIRKNLNL